MTEEEKKSVKKNDQTDSLQNKKSQRGVVAAIIAGSVVIVVVMIGAGVWFARNYHQGMREADRSVFQAESGFSKRGEGSPFGYGRAIHSEISQDAVTTTVYTYFTGVVIAVNTDDIVVAGNGEQKTIRTNSDTVYINDNKPEVNDTVTIVGTTEDDGITATRIGIANR